MAPAGEPRGALLPDAPVDLWALRGMRPAGDAASCPRSSPRRNNVKRSRRYVLPGSWQGLSQPWSRCRPRTGAAPEVRLGRASGRPVVADIRRREARRPLDHGEVGRSGASPVEPPGIADRSDSARFEVAPPASCDHDGKASGRLVLEDGRVRREVVCECGQVVMLLGRQEYRFNGWLGGASSPAEPASAGGDRGRCCSPPPGDVAGARTSVTAPVAGRARAISGTWAGTGRAVIKRRRETKGQVRRSP
jgi:hypothetical protein